MGLVCRNCGVEAIDAESRCRQCDDEGKQEPVMARRVCYNCGTGTNGDEPRCLRCCHTLPKSAAELGAASVVFPRPEEVAGPQPRPQQPQTKKDQARAKKAQRLQLQAQMTPKERFYSQYRHFVKVVLKIGFAIFIWELCSTIGKQPGQTGAFDNVLIAYCVLIFVLILPIIQVALWRIISAGFDAANVAAIPIPTPEHIAFQLGQEWGRPATVEEVAAVHQMLTSRRNEAFVTAGLTFGGIYLLSKHH
jgi:hypothetical protein